MLAMARYEYTWTYMYVSAHEFANDAGPFTSYLSIIGVVIVEFDSNSICMHGG